MEEKAAAVAKLQAAAAQAKREDEFRRKSRLDAGFAEASAATSMSLCALVCHKHLHGTLGLLPPIHRIKRMLLLLAKYVQLVFGLISFAPASSCLSPLRRKPQITVHVALSASDKPMMPSDASAGVSESC